MTWPVQGPPAESDPDQPGWYRDPEDTRRHRYWTGTTWLTQEEALEADRARRS